MAGLMTTEERLRPHPETRFSYPELKFDLRGIATQLLSEPHAGEGGHRQQTLYHNAGTTIALFVFDRFTRIPGHQVNGVVSMHILRGQFRIDTDSQEHHLQTGQMLILAPGQKHTVIAEDEGEMLLMVNLASE
jgi:quercetin dioxygenase-like cupin family protein